MYAEVDSVELVEKTEPVSSVLIYGDLTLNELSLLGLEAKQSLLNTGVLSVNLTGAPSVERIIDVNLSNLQSIGRRLSINNNETLVDFCGLKSFAENKPNSVRVEILYNPYNPTINDIANGNCSQ